MRTINLFLTFMLLFFISGAAQAQVSNTRSVISGPGQITVTYDLVTTCGTADVTLYYSPNKCDWYEAVTVSGALTSQTTGNDKQIIWDNAADHVTSGKIYFKVETSSLPDFEEGVVINGIRWATRNLDCGGCFVPNDYDPGAHYQWGRQTDGHECSSLLHDNAVSGADLDLNGQVATTSAAYGKFIRHIGQPAGDWRIPLDVTRWNGGTESSPLKTVSDPCPAGWRVPTQTELSSLVQTANVTAVWTFDYNSSRVNGTVFTDNATLTSIFLPAADGRSCCDGTLWDGGGNNYWSGYYWSSTESSGLPGYITVLDTDHSGVQKINEGFQLMNGLSVRCVKDE